MAPLKKPSRPLAGAAAEGACSHEEKAEEAGPQDMEVSAEA